MQLRLGAGNEAKRSDLVSSEIRYVPSRSSPSGRGCREETIWKIARVGGGDGSVAARRKQTDIIRGRELRSFGPKVAGWSAAAAVAFGPSAVWVQVWQMRDRKKERKPSGRFGTSHTQVRSCGTMYAQPQLGHFGAVARCLLAPSDTNNRSQLPWLADRPWAPGPLDPWIPNSNSLAPSSWHQ